MPRPSPWNSSADAVPTCDVGRRGCRGLGPTHLWEAELALARYRRDPTLRLIPVALPGLSPVCIPTKSRTDSINPLFMSISPLR